MDDQVPGGTVRRPTVRDVAQRAGVSPSTVSNVLNARQVLDPATRARVEAAIAELGYVRSVAARGLRVRAMPVLGLLIEDDSRMAMRDPVHAQLLAGLLDRARQRGLGITVHAAAREPDDASIVRFVASGHAAGVVLSLQGGDGERPGLLERLAGLGIPLVLFERSVAPPGIGTVSTDNAGGSRALHQHLHELGHRRFLYLGSAVSWPGPERRLAAFLEAAKAAGDEVEVAHAPAWTVDAAHAAALPLLAGWPQDRAARPSAVAAGNDHLAAGVLAAARDVGLQVPRDLSVVGFSDLEIAVRVAPALTSVAFDPAAEGELAADLLIAHIDGRPTVDVLAVPATIVVRASSGPPPAGG